MRRAADPLARYRAMRDLAATPEPSGASRRKAKRRRVAAPTFVIQKHAASRLHYDFRLEVDGVLKSWAVPKGPSTDPRDKRLAMQVEDHPLDYASFEGVIPEGHYGAGPVIVWDRGTWENRTLDENGEPAGAAAAIAAGKLDLWLDGEKLRGGFVLLRTRADPRGRSWLLVKRKDEFAHRGRDVARAEPRSVLSRRTIEEVARDA